MDDFERSILEATEAAGVAGLCLEGRIEIGVQAARRLRPDLDDATLTRRVTAVLRAAGEADDAPG